MKINKTKLFRDWKKQHETKQGVNSFTYFVESSTGTREKITTSNAENKLTYIDRIFDDNLETFDTEQTYKITSYKFR